MKFDITSPNAMALRNTESDNRMLSPVSVVPFQPAGSSFTTFLLLDVQDSVAARARMVGILEVFHKEGDQAAAKN